MCSGPCFTSWPRFGRSGCCRHRRRRQTRRAPLRAASPRRPTAAVRASQPARRISSAGEGTLYRRPPSTSPLPRYEIAKHPLRTMSTYGFAPKSGSSPSPERRDLRYKRRRQRRASHHPRAPRGREPDLVRGATGAEPGATRVIVQTGALNEPANVSTPLGSDVTRSALLLLTTLSSIVSVQRSTLVRETP
jgi:hypothetical protein